MIDVLKQQLNKKAGEKQYIESELSKTESKLIELETRVESVEKAQVIIQTVAQITQQQLTVRIADIVSMALEAVFGDDAYSFEISFVQKRGKTEAELFFNRGGELIDPMSASGGGAVDVAAFALRVAFWQLMYKKNMVSNTIVLDEPFRFLSKDLQPRAGEMLKLLSDKLKIQFLIVTHNDDLSGVADKLIHVEKRGSKSIVARGE